MTIHVPSDEFGRDPDEDEEADTVQPAADATENGAPPAAKKKTRRGSRGGKNRKRPAGAGAAAAATNGAEPGGDAELAHEPEAVTVLEEPANGDPTHPEPAFEEAAFEEQSVEEPETIEPEPEPAPVAATPDDADAEGGDWGYVPMSEWGDDLKPSR